MRNRKRVFLFGFLAFLVVAGIILFLPPVWSRVTYHVQEIYTTIKYKLFPPEKVIFVPGESTPNQVATAVQATFSALVTPTAQLTPTPIQFTPTPTVTPIPLPSSILLTGIRQEPEEWNNCGPATLAMYLSYWKWQFPGDQSNKSPQDNIAPIVKPNSRDKNVMPYELENYILENTNLQVMVRVGGDLQTIKQLLNAGIPIMIEKGFETAKQGWMGHYELVVGYDDVSQVFLTQDSYLIIATPQAKNFQITYDEFYRNWRAFNYLFLVVYPQDKQYIVGNMLGPLADEKTAIQIAHDRALADTTQLADPRDRYFAWFDLGSSLVNMQDYANAAAAYDQAFTLYPTITESVPPWRMLWYQTGPYFAYYYSGRYQDVLNLANTTLEAISEKVLEESFYWRAMAELQLGDQTSAVADLRKSLEVHANFAPSVNLLQQIGINP